VDPDNIPALADGLLSILTDGALRARLITRGHEQVRHFTWTEAARQTITVYRDLAS
jgi:glycosyltransferase involved in cell wall biosynthesis